jgi:hypothetical protein
MTSLDGEALLRVNRAVERFEDSWWRGEPWPIEDLLRGESDTRARAELLSYALAIELEHRRRRGEAPTPGDYEERFPDYPAVVRRGLSETRTGSITAGSSAATCVNDAGMADAVISAPAYTYLIAFRPDGTDQLCAPDREDSLPARTTPTRYPPASRSNSLYRLSEGHGLYAFALVVSRGPLPPYRDWKHQQGSIPWASGQKGDPGVVWRDDERGLHPLLATGPQSIRGKDAIARDSGGPAAKLANWLRARPGVDAVTVEAFTAEPALGP